MLYLQLLHNFIINSSFNVLIILFVSCHFRYGRFYNIPVNIMINSMASYGVFLFLLWYQSNQNKTLVKRGPPHSGVEFLIVIYVISFLCNTAYRCHLLGKLNYPIFIFLNFFSPFILSETDLHSTYLSSISLPTYNTVISSFSFLFRRI